MQHGTGAKGLPFGTAGDDFLFETEAGTLRSWAARLDIFTTLW
jgi:hypothetical protein